jgi:uncharacterized protein (DUF2235 family)
MTKNIVICLDGTGNEVKASGRSNVLKLFELLDLRDAGQQVGYYDPGVGTFSAPSAWSAPARAISKLGGMAIGNGMRQNLGEAYSYLMSTWEPGDQVFVFGFSRGAYTARALAGMVHRVGLLRPGSENLISYAVGVYARRRNSDLAGAEGWDRIDVFSAALCRTTQGKSLSLPIHFLGLFDTVKAASVLGRDLKWPYTRSLPNVAEVRHAVSIDEKRRPYREYLVEPKPGKPPRLSETWFAGVHSDVGGGFPDHPELGNITLRWMVDGATQAGLIVRPKMLATRYTIDPKDALGEIHHMGKVWALATYRKRPLPAGCQVHASVRHHMSAEPDYAPRLPPDVVWDDASWPAPEAAPGEPQ